MEKTGKIINTTPLAPKFPYVRVVFHETIVEVKIYNSSVAFKIGNGIPVLDCKVTTLSNGELHLKGTETEFIHISTSGDIKPKDMAGDENIDLIDRQWESKEDNGDPMVFGRPVWWKFWYRTHYIKEGTWKVNTNRPFTIVTNQKYLITKRELGIFN